ncbi:hypothetical protein LXA43DRAFT_1083153 [Ganoderma leucocontextum]|nr:hypothetical protein LXA43DRAFT_1083153 [Ganoderma leucocontextum]
MSASPQPPPPPPNPEPTPQTNGSPPASSSGSPAQLATLLAKALQESDVLKAELSTVKRRADKAERLLATFQSNAQSPTNGSPPSSSQGASSKDSWPSSARKAVLEYENRADRAELARDEALARLQMIQESWQELDRYFAALELRASDTRAQFSRLIADGGGPLVQVNAVPPSSQNAVYVPTLVHGAIHLPQIPPARSHLPRTSSHRLSTSQPFPSIPLPPPPSATSSRVRPRAGSMDAGYGGTLSGPGAPPPAKRPRADRDDDRSRGRRYSHSPSNSPHPAYLSNGHAADHSPQLAPHSVAASALHPHSHYHPYQHPSARPDRDDPRYAYPDQHRSRRRVRSTSRGPSSRSRSRGSASSLEDMLIEATTTGEDNPGHVHGHRAVHPGQHLHPSSRHRSPSPGREYHLGVPSQHGRARASSTLVNRGVVGAPGQIASPPGPLLAPGQSQTFQTHIFAPPVTGAPVKKSKLGATASLSGNGSVLTLGPTGSVISGPSTIGGGGFPPTNAAGQRICRQCGLPGRYKEGKCVEKWGPGPEGPGTVCDRCRKKMKRVERRGTLDSQNMAAMHHQPAAIHPSGAPQAAPGSLTNGRISGSDRHVHRTDTIQAHPSSQSQSRLGPSGTHLLSGSQSGYVRHERDRDHDRDRDQGASSYHHSYSASRSSQRGPTPPGIAILPGSSANEDEGAYDGRAHHRSRDRDRDPAHAHGAAAPPHGVNGHISSSRSASHSPTLNSRSAAGAPTSASARGSPRGSDGKSKSSSDLMDVDADGEEVDADADGDAEADADGDEADADAEADPEADADAELLEAVDAAEANNATDEEWLKKEDA